MNLNPQNISDIIVENGLNIHSISHKIT